MTQEPIEFDPVDAIGAGAFGQPGERTFVIQARKGSAMLSVLVEKEQVALLAAEAERRGDVRRGLRRALDRARVHNRDREHRESRRRGTRLLDTLVGEMDAGHATREQRAGVRGDAVPYEHETRRRFVLGLLG